MTAGLCQETTKLAAENSVVRIRSIEASDDRCPCRSDRLVAETPCQCLHTPCKHPDKVCAIWLPARGKPACWWYAGCLHSSSCCSFLNVYCQARRGEPRGELLYTL